MVTLLPADIFFSFLTIFFSSFLIVFLAAFL